MSLQVFLQAQLLGSEAFLAAPGVGTPDESLTDFLGRSAWVALLCEVLPRALLAELKLSRMLLGSSSAEQFFLLLPEEALPAANEFLNAAAADVAELSLGLLRLTWVSTEELGSWPVARKRLDDAFLATRSAPLASANAEAVFAPFAHSGESDDAQEYFAQFAAGFAEGARIGWPKEQPARLLWDGGEYSWPLQADPQGGEANDNSVDSVLFPRRIASDDSGARPATLAELGSRAEGTPSWAVLCGDVDQFAARLRGASSIENFLQTSFLFKRFFAGELGILCTLPEFWRKVTLVSCGGDDFTVLGSWDALLSLAREVGRIFDRFAEQNQLPAATADGRTITMALTLPSDPSSPVSAVYEACKRALRTAKSTDAGTLHLFGNTLEWKRLQDAEDLKGSLVRLARDFGFGSEFIGELTAVYRETFATRSVRRNKSVRVEKPWRTYMQVARVLPSGRSKELLNVRNAVLTQLLGKRTSGMKLRPSARVGLDWARWAAGH